jgi:integrase
MKIVPPRTRSTSDTTLFDLLNGTIHLEPGTTKNKEGREVTMTKTVSDLLSQCIHFKTADDFVFTREENQPVRYFRRTWKSVCKKAGVPNLLFHDFRRTAARNLRRAGVAEGVIMKIGGWRTRTVFERYAIVAQSDIADALSQLESRRFGHDLGHNQENGANSATHLPSPIMPAGIC